MTALYQEDAYLKECEAQVVSSGPEGVVLSQTVFYPTGGGQPGDSGALLLEDGSELKVIDARKGSEPGTVLHVIEEGASPPPAGTKVKAAIDWARRHRHMRMHTCLHVLCSLVEGDVTGGSVGDGKGRLDFNLPESPDKEALEAEVNRVIAEDHPVRPRWVSDAELESNPDLVRTMSVRPPSGFGQVRLLEIEDVDLQACGGTHVAHTGEIGRIRIGKIENKGKQNRRINIILEEA